MSSNIVWYAGLRSVDLKTGKCATEPRLEIKNFAVAEGVNVTMPSTTSVCNDAASNWVDIARCRYNKLLTEVLAMAVAV